MEVSVTDNFSDNTETLRDLGLDRGRISLASGRNSDIQPIAALADDTEATFAFDIPQRDVTQIQEEKQVEESELANESMGMVEDEAPYEAPFDLQADEVLEEESEG